MLVFSTRFCWAIFILLKIAEAIQVAPLEILQIGPYYVQNCKSNNNNIATLLNTLRNTLQPVLTDLRSTTSSDAYNTFFKDIAHAPYVRKVFSNITKGMPVPPEPGMQSWAPAFICVDARDQVTFSMNNKRVDAFTLCYDLGGKPAYGLLTSPYIVICPMFFTEAAIPVQSTASCLTVNSHRNKFVQHGKSLTEYQLWNIMHELVQYYVYSTGKPLVDFYDINFCLGLNGRSAVLNAQSYVYYAANIRLGCTKFPIVRTRPPGRVQGVELLEMDANRTVLNANESSALVVQNVSIHAVPSVQTSEIFDPDLTSRKRMKSD